MELNNKIKIPSDVHYIIQKLNSKGFEAYIVGGCVRDSILDRVPSDWDITTSAEPDEIKTLFEKTIDTGIKHGTLTILLNDVNYEVTTYRVDGKYIDNRRPETVSFTKSIEEDLSRRDFTINSIAYHPQNGYIDPFSGISDIKNGIISTVGTPSDRFSEDALRMLRAIRFSAQLGFEIEIDTYNAIKTNSSLIQNISWERIRDEVTKLLISPIPQTFKLLNDANLLKYIIPEFEICFHTPQNNPYHIYDVANHILKSLSVIENDKILRWAMLLHDIGKPYTKTTDEKGIDHFYGHAEKSVELAKAILARLRFDKKTCKIILRLIEHHDRNINANYKSVRKSLNVVGEDIFLSLLQVQHADKKSQNPDLNVNRLKELNEIKNIYLYIKRNEQCIKLEDLNISGQDLINIGINQGKEIGIILKKLLGFVIDEPVLNTKKDLTELTLKHFTKFLK